MGSSWQPGTWCLGHMRYNGADTTCSHEPRCVFIDQCVGAEAFVSLLARKRTTPMSQVAVNYKLMSHAFSPAVVYVQELNLEG